jgi:hypothetical protein
MLAYLYGAKGDRDKAQALWAAMAPPEKTGLAAVSQAPSPSPPAPAP